MVKFMLLIIGISTAKRFPLLMLLLMLEAKKGLEGVVRIGWTGCVFGVEFPHQPCVKPVSRQPYGRSHLNEDVGAFKRCAAALAAAPV